MASSGRTASRGSAAAEPLDRRFERPNAFDLAAYWAESSAAYEREAPRAEVVIRIRPERLGWLSEAVGHRAADEAERLEVPDPEGWVHLRLHVEWPDEVSHAMLRLGSGVEVLEPREVREQVVATAQRILDRYGEAAVREETAAVAVGR